MFIFIVSILFLLFFMRNSLLILITLICGSCNPRLPNQAYQGKDPDTFDCSSLDSLFEKLDEPEPGEWLYSHEEYFQDLETYIENKPHQIDEKRKIIYIQPIGNFDSVSILIIDKTADFFTAFFGLEVKINPVISDSVIPDKARRINFESEQWKTKYILHDLLRPSMPKDAFVIIALTDHDLYPDEEWNYVFGQASLKHGVGVWSYYRFGSPYLPDYMLLEFYKRVLRTAGHETCHMFSIKHCVSYNCLMNGSNSLEEADRKPLYLCSRCLEKLCWNLNMDPKDHLKRMADFWKKEKIFHTSHFYERCLKAAK
jgi:archaemetzincin